MVGVEDTLYAPASGGGRAAVAVIRLSGAGAGSAITRLTGDGLPPPRRAVLRAIKDPASGEIIDRGLILWMPGPGSFTGEDMAEFQVHGGTANLARLADALDRIPGLRPAEAGEFTRRAFENQKLDLTSAEGIADLVNAETEAQRRQAFRQSEGELGRLYEEWREALLSALAHLTASIDFSDEELPDDLAERWRRQVAATRKAIDSHLEDDHRGESLRDGVYVVILGAPNVGKSSLLNKLARRDLAIVSEVAGTTRDLIEVRLDLGGYPVVLVDTAGMRQATDDLEHEGVRRALSRAEHADLKVLVTDADRWPKLDRQSEGLIDGTTLLVVNKIDLGTPTAPLHYSGKPVFGLSAKTGAGMDRFLRALSETVKERYGGHGLTLTRRRHRTALEQCRAQLTEALKHEETEIAAEYLRQAVESLGRITGRVGVEDMLDLVFRDFCIGK